MIPEIVAAILLTLSSAFTSASYEITVYSDPLPMQPSEYSAIWLNPGETVQGSIHAVENGVDWFYVHRRNHESGWLEFSYGKMKVTKFSYSGVLELAQ